MGGVWELNLPPNEKFVLLAMADHADHAGRNVRPSVRMVATKTGYSEREVQYIVRKLERSGLLVRTSEGKGGRGNPTHYRIDLSKGAISAPIEPERVQTSAPIDEEKGAISAPFEPERVQSETVKGATHCTRTVIEPSLDVVVVDAALAPDAYVKTLDKTFAIIANRFGALDPQFSRGWLVMTMRDAATKEVQQSLGYEALSDGMMNAYERIAESLGNGRRRTGSVTGYARSIIFGALKEAAL